jgi:hypothetical protein
MKRSIDQKIRLPKSILMIGLLPALVLLTPSEIARSQSPSLNSASQNETVRAEDLIKLSRAAIGGEEVLKKIETITATGKYKRFGKYISVQSPQKVVNKQFTLPGKMEFEFALPDKFRRRITGARLRGFKFSFTQVVSGAEAWREPPMPPMAVSGNRRVIDVSDVERTEFIQAATAKQELSYYSIGWLMRPLPGYPLEMSYLGTYQLGAENTHAIMAEGASGFRFTLFLDAKNYAPVALAISFVAEIQPMVLIEAPYSFNPKFRLDVRERARTERIARLNPPQPCEVLIRFSDRRPVNGIILPFKVTTSINGDVIEEMIMSRFQINQPINPKKFAGPPEMKN